jgi:hypothetical protein
VARVCVWERVGCDSMRKYLDFVVGSASGM